MAKPRILRKPIIYGRIAVLFKQGKTKKEVLKYLQKHYHPTKNITEIAEIYNPKTGINSNILLKLETKPKQTIASILRKRENQKKGAIKRFKKPGERKKISKRLMGRKVSTETRAKLSKKQKGKKATKETKTKISKAGKKRYENPKEREMQRQRMLNYWAKIKGEIIIRMETNGIIPAHHWIRGIKGETRIERIAGQLPQPEKNTITEKQIKIIRKEMKKLPTIQQTVIGLKYYNGLTITEISKKIGKNPTQTQKILTQAIRNLAKNPKIQKLR